MLVAFARWIDRDGEDCHVQVVCGPDESVAVYALREDGTADTVDLYPGMSLVDRAEMVWWAQQKLAEDAYYNRLEAML